MARENGTRLAFLDLPFYDGCEAPAELHWLEQFGPVWSATQLRGDPRNYRDAAHGSPRAVPVINAWLAEKIAQDEARNGADRGR